MNKAASRKFLYNAGLLSLACCIVMMHFVFSRAFRDSMLGSRIPISTLPVLIVIGTLFSLLVSFGLSWALRRLHRASVIVSSFFLSAGCEFLLARGVVPVQYSAAAFYVLISLSTAIGLSLFWLLASDWFSHEPDYKAKAVPLLLASGTMGGLLAGVGLVHLAAAADFNTANLILAGMNVVSGLLLLGYRPHLAAPKATQEASVSKRRAKRQRLVVASLAIATLLGATASTLLDLTYRISAAEHFHSQGELLHFFGYLQAMLGVAAVAAQLGLSRWRPSPRRSLMAAYALGAAATAGLAVLFPSFALLTMIRTGEYAMRNSLFRFGTEMTYSELPDGLRHQARPVIDVLGERLGDSVAAGLLQLLLITRHGLPIRLTLVCLAVIALVLYKVCQRIVRFTAHRHTAVEPPHEDAPQMLAYAAAEEKADVA